MPELNDSQWSDFEKLGDRILSELRSLKSPAFLIDLTGLNYVGSATVALMVRLWKELDKQNGRMVIVNQSEMIDEVLTLAGLSKVWNIVPSHEEALKYLRVAGPPRKVLVVFSIIGLLALAGGAAGLYSSLSEFEFLQEPLEFSAIIGFAALACFSGLWVAVRGAGWWRWAGAMMVLAGGVLIAVGAFDLS
jgi:anti-anti-sigma factor